MKDRIWLYILCVIVVLSLAGCSVPADATLPSTDPSATPASLPEASALEVYGIAAEAVQMLTDYALEISRHKTVTVGAETYKTDTVQSVHYKDFDTSQMQAYVTETVSIGTHTITIEEYYYDGTVYATISDAFFAETMRTAEYSSRYAPMVLLNAQKYSDISFAPNDGNTIWFHGPMSAETWAIPGDSVFQSAEGSITLADGQLKSSTYTVTYTSGPAQVTEQITVSVSTEPQNIEQPKNLEQYLRIESLDAVRRLEEAYGHLISADVVSATVNDSINCQAGGIFRGQTTKVNTCHLNGRTLAEVDIDVSVTNYSKNGETTLYNQLEKYIDGIYTVNTNGKISTNSANVTSDEMKSYCRDFLVSTLPVVQQIYSISVTERGVLLLIEFACNEELAQIMCNTACSTLYENPYLLDQLSTKTTVTELKCYLAIDTRTGLPTSSGISYSGTHSIDGYIYELTYQIDQAYVLADWDVYEAITGELPDREQSVDSPTPPLYQITNCDGQTLWLLGTTEIGDVRTSHLPTPIMDALRRSDVLALEFDTEQLQEDPQLLQELTKLCYFTEGTLLDDCLDEATLTLATQYAKAAGLNNILLSRIKPVILGYGLKTFFISCGYELTPAGGVNRKLLAIAQELEMDIHNTGTAEAVMLAMTELPVSVQTQLLEAVLEDGMAETCNDAHKLYSAWCDGDNTVMRKAVMEALSINTFDENIDALQIVEKRSQILIEKIKEYIDSNQTVFMTVDIVPLLVDNGVLDSLISAGYTVEQIPYA